MEKADSVLVNNCTSSSAVICIWKVLQDSGNPFATFEACGACIKFPVVSDDGSDPACDDAYIPEPIHPRYRPSRFKSSFYSQTARFRIELVVWYST
jgi:hypothetical protein